MNLTSNQLFVLNYLKQTASAGEYISPTRIGSAFKPCYHSSWASPICKKLAVMGLLERNHQGWWRIKQ